MRKGGRKTDNSERKSKVENPGRKGRSAIVSALNSYSGIDAKSGKQEQLRREKGEARGEELILWSPGKSPRMRERKGDGGKREKTGLGGGHKLGMLNKDG